jgi:hypothetical protein
MRNVFLLMLLGICFSAVVGSRAADDAVSEWTLSDGKTFRGSYEYSARDPATGQMQYAFRDEHRVWRKMNRAELGEKSIAEIDEHERRSTQPTSRVSSIPARPTTEAANQGAAETTNVAVERIKAFPERYQGKALRFTKAEINGELERHFDHLSKEDYFALGVTLERDGYVTKVVGDFNLAFITSAKLGEQLIERLGKHEYFIDTDLDCVLAEVGADSGRKIRVLRVQSVTVRNVGGRVVTTLR